ncbi:MAG: thioredoxin family protein [Bacteroidales bacterium]|nr:thioredoxin family protein [Bacteroidales bacterium]MCF8403613.1 thioredoxin family protein [Bacteroidales bacterium]
MKKQLFFLGIILLQSFFSFAEILEPVKWAYESKQIEGNTYELTFKASIDRTWHLYSQNVPEGGPVKTSFYFYELNGFTLAEDVQVIEEESFTEENNMDYIVLFSEPKGHEENDPNFNMIVKYFEEEAVFKQTIRLNSSDPLTVTGYIYFMCCDDSRCLPPAEVEFEFLFNGATPTLSAQTNSGEGAALIEVETIGELGETVDAQPKYKRTTEIIKDKSVLVNDLSNKSLWELFFFSILAGLAAILTPCVFPMIPMTVSFFMKDPDKKSHAKLQAIAFGISIILIYTIVGTLIAVTLGVNFANWLSTHWIPNVLFFLIFVIFAASFFGMFEITMPSWMINKSDAKADKGGITGSFFMAFTLVLVSFSCTGPLVGLILVEAAGGAWLEPIVGMLGFSVAFALPFTLFAFFPSWMNKLPKSGGWLNSVKVILGFIELALGLKFLSVADQTYHWGLLDREIYLALWIIIFGLMGLYLLGKIKFSHDSDVKFISVPRLFLVIITFTFVAYLIPGMFGAPLKALSGYLPPMASHDFDFNEISRRNAMTVAGVKNESSICEKPMYSEFLHLPHGLKGYYDYGQGLGCAQKLDKPIFIDFTGHGCVNCREMEANVWSDPKVLDLLKNEFVVISLYVDDKTPLPESEWVLSSADNKLKKSIGKVYADLQIYNFNVNAQPYYVLLNHDGGLLAQPRAYDLDIEAYVEFLEGGLEMFKNDKHL